MVSIGTYISLVLPQLRIGTEKGMHKYPPFRNDFSGCVSLHPAVVGRNQVCQLKGKGVLRYLESVIVL